MTDPIRVTHYKHWFLALEPADIVDTVVNAPSYWSETEQAEMQAGLCAMAHEHPEVTQYICPAFTVPGNPRLVRIFLALAYDLWRVNPTLLRALLIVVHRTGNSEVQRMTAEVLAQYKNGESAEFSDFLTVYGF